MRPHPLSIRVVKEKHISCLVPAELMHSQAGKAGTWRQEQIIRECKVKIAFLGCTPYFFLPVRREEPPSQGALKVDKGTRKV